MTTENVFQPPARVDDGAAALIRSPRTHVLVLREGLPVWTADLRRRCLSRLAPLAVTGSGHPASAGPDARLLAGADASFQRQACVGAGDAWDARDALAANGRVIAFGSLPSAADESSTFHRP